MKLLKRVINVFSKLFDTLHEANVLISQRFLNHLKLESFARWRQGVNDYSEAYISKKLRREVFKS